MHTMTASGEPARPRLISTIVPTFNEEDNVALFLERLAPVLESLDLAAEIVFVNDGSSDQTLASLLTRQAADPRLRIVDLSRNFGKEAALAAGLQAARGDAAIIIDCDLQDPPELIRDFVQRWREGFRVVRGQRVDRSVDTPAKRLTAAWFYRLHNRLADNAILPNTGDFCLLDRSAIDAILALPERTRFMKGLLGWIGFRHAVVSYHREPRRAGRTKWSYWRLWNFALDGLMSASTLPLRIWTYLGAIIAFGTFVYALFIVALALWHGIDVPGYASLITVVLFLGGVQLTTLGVIGEYVGRIYAETKQRPLFFVERIYEPAASQSTQEAPHGSRAVR